MKTPPQATAPTPSHAAPNPVTADPFADLSGLSETEQDYLFELRGFRVLHGAIPRERLEAINNWVDQHDLESLKPGQWIGDVEVHTYGGKDGINFQNIIEGGEPFEQLIDNPAWYEPIHRQIATSRHQLIIEENLLNVRDSGGYIPIHAGGTNPRFTSSFYKSTGVKMVGQINVLMALTDVGPGDGATTVVPGSHLSHRDHPNGEGAWDRNVTGDQAAGMVEVNLKAGDAVMFTDAITHGSLPRTNPGQRRVLIYRYTPHLMATRYHYLPTPELLGRLTERQRKMVQPRPPRMRPGRTVTFEGNDGGPTGG